LQLDRIQVAKVAKQKRQRRENIHFAALPLFLSASFLLIFLSAYFLFADCDYAANFA
jgi:hypothetical protein